MKINLLKLTGISAIVLSSFPALSAESDRKDFDGLLEVEVPWHKASVRKVITGKVVDEKNLGVPGVGVKILPPDKVR